VDPTIRPTLRAEAINRATSHPTPMVIATNIDNPVITFCWGTLPSRMAASKTQPEKNPVINVISISIAQPTADKITRVASLNHVEVLDAIFIVGVCMIFIFFSFCKSN
jgi:hypothetical protein